MGGVRNVKGKIGTAEFTGATASPLPVLDDGKPLSEFCIFTSGVNESDYGPVVFDEIAAAFVMQNWATKANGLHFDYNHGMALKYATAEQAKSAGDFSLEVRNGDLYAVGCMWTEEAAARITKREYNLFSPFFDYIDSDSEMDGENVRRPYCLHNVAILNIAGLNGIQQIAAAAASIKENDMSPEEIKRLQDRAAALEIENATLRGHAHEVAIIGGTLALGSTATAADRSRAVSGLLELRAEVRRVTKKDTDEGAIGVLHALASDAAETATLREQLGTIEAGAMQSQLDHVFEMGAKAGSSAATPAGRKKFEEGVMKSMLALTGGKITAAVIEAAKERIELAAKLTVVPHKEKHPSDPTVLVLPDVLAGMVGNGVTRKSIEAAYARQQARRNPPAGSTS